MQSDSPQQKAALTFGGVKQARSGSDQRWYQMSMYNLEKFSHWLGWCSSVGWFGWLVSLKRRNKKLGVFFHSLFWMPQPTCLFRESNVAT